MVITKLVKKSRSNLHIGSSVFSCILSITITKFIVEMRILFEASWSFLDISTTQVLLQQQHSFGLPSSSSSVMKLLFSNVSTNPCFCSNTTIIHHCSHPLKTASSWAHCCSSHVPPCRRGFWPWQHSLTQCTCFHANVTFLTCLACMLCLACLSFLTCLTCMGC